ncbi:MarR family winged helix-turn-helix transcriptional regulator [Stenotrophobium rhamnosiphilum]|uniref:MarR family transcriptional regulator n=1 Tax=Stenotrophobium rhamnosiphilum TaxID=2029166 RepID=A0A2T5MKA4_9GAMM|nr:MarR family transcriptional regulator [Stenotrophobium rhamnosiphilum]PTU33005.1 MarR family transcriptional regulator [Stenotrophobium rhamnosiphilum]
MHKHYQPEGYRARTSIGYLIKRSHSLMSECLEVAFAQKDFTFMQWVVLMTVRDGLAVTATDICRDYRHDQGALTRVIDQLETRGLLERQRSTEDRRVVQLALTEQGSKTVESLIPVVVERLNTALDGFTVDEVGELTRLLGKLVSRVEVEMQK